MFSSLINTLFPISCPGCKVPGTAICNACFSKIPYADSDKSVIFPGLDYGNSLVSSAIKDLKYKKHSPLATEMMNILAPEVAEFLSDHMQSLIPQKIYFVPIPQHPRRKAERGFNQTEVLCNRLSKSIEGGIVSNVLRKLKYTDTQTKKNKNARMESVHMTMSALVKDISGIYVVVDDVYTTGATFEEAKRALLSAGARSVLFVSLAHGFRSI